MHSFSGIADVSNNTVSTLLADSGKACIAIHNQKVQGVQVSKAQCG